MKMLRSLVLLVPTVLFACGGATTASPDLSPTSGGSDAMPDPSATQPETSGAYPTGDGSEAACNTLSNDDAPSLLEEAATGPVPVGVGGAIVDGRYVRTAIFVYDGTAAAETSRAALRVRGNVVEIASTDSLLDLRVTATIATSGVSSQLRISCPAAADGGLTAGPLETYTATPTSISFFDPAKQRVFVFTKP